MVEADKKKGTMLIKEVHAERIKEFFENKFDYAKILQLIKEKPGLNVWQISGALYLDWPKVKHRINKLKELGLIKEIEGEKITPVRKKTKFFFLADFLEKINQRDIIDEIEKRRKEENEKRIKREKINYGKENK